MDKKFDEAISSLCDNLYSVLNNLSDELKQQIQEIRLRAFKPVILHFKNESYFLSKNGELLQEVGQDAIVATQSDITNSLNKMCSYSIYSYQNELKNGYITLKGGHRVGVCGTAVFNNDTFTNIKDISSINIRIARNVNCVQTEVIKNLIDKFSGILIVGEPASGKTTFLRDIAKKLSIGFFKDMKKVVVIDERGEFSGTSNGIAQNDMGFCDILNDYPKPIGIMQALRTLSPEIIICDEIGGDSDIKAIESGINSGVKFIASMHAGNIYELLRRPPAKRVLNTGAFDKVVMLKGKNAPGEIERIFSLPNNDFLNSAINKKSLSAIT
ncbi:MAG: hypothetical protein RUMPE_00701 [Eubacteriales bacterium SKADARSKE-1]|nr:hypothetical protein [Eubacteriales bacterium SKADARSKE-1]